VSGHFGLRNLHVISAALQWVLMHFLEGKMQFEMDPPAGPFGT
jgi:hypothetical protein